MIILLIYLLILGAMLLAYGVSYALKGIGMYSLGKARGMENSWLAFVPYARLWFQGELCGEITFKERRLTNLGIWMVLVPVVANIITGIVFGGIWSVAFLKISQTTNMFAPYGHYSYDSIGSMGGALLIGVLLAMLFFMITGAVQSILIILVNQQIFARYTDRNYALLHAVAGVFLPLYTAIYFFLIRNRELK